MPRLDRPGGTLGGRPTAPPSGDAEGNDARRIIDRGIVVDAATLADPAVPVKSLARG